MLFNSIQFAIFFPITLIAYFVMPHKFRWFVLLLASCYFYMVAFPVYILILFGMIIVDYFAGILIDGSEGKKRKIWLIVSIISNVGVLAIFKYYDFFINSFNYHFLWPASGHALPLLHLILPVGLSFHTFQAMSYTFEVFYRRQKPERHLGIYALYVMFYPQLVAGPIERPQNIMHQFREVHRFNRVDFGLGMRRIGVGLFKKMVIADRLSQVVDPVYSSPSSFGPFTLLIVTIFFAFQIYTDFSGYSDIAVGSARCMGFKLMENFRHPYLSVSIAEFWSRWHISLSTWFRDYLYIPLGGNRKSWFRWQMNLLVTFLISGLWHGANWTYMLWGGFNGLYLVLANIKNRILFGLSARARPSSRATPKYNSILSWATTFLAIALTWVYFRAKNVRDANYIVMEIVRGAFLPTSTFKFDEIPNVSAREVWVGLGLIGFLMTAEWCQEKWGWGRHFVNLNIFVRWTVYYAVALSIIFLGIFNQSAFIYFQF